MDLVKLERTIPIKSIPEAELNAIIINEFTVWIASLLSLTDEVSADRLTVALPAIKEHCWSMGFQEIKKMFEMYVDGKLSVKPLPNYFDRIMLGKIVEAYKIQRPKKTKKIELPEMTEDQKDEIMVEAVKNAHKEYLQTGMLGDAPIGQYDWLDKKGLLQKAFKFSDFQWKHRKIEAYNATKELLKAVYQSEVKIDSDRANEIRSTLKSLENAKNGEVIAESKKMLLKEYYDTLIVEV